MSQSRAKMATAVGLFLVWYASWTFICNIGVLAQLHYATLIPLALAVPTILTFGSVRSVHRLSVAEYASLPADREIPTVLPKLWLVAVAVAAFGAALVLALNIRSHDGIINGSARGAISVATVIVLLTSLFPAWVASRSRSRSRPDAPSLSSATGRGWWRYLILVSVLMLIYYLGHRADPDESNFVNLALGAQRTHGAVYQYDTMLGDGPLGIALRTYRLQTFELLAAAVSTVLHVEPITAAHLILPAPQIALIAGVIWLLLEPVLGRRWLAAGLLVPAFLMIDTQAYSSWGLHGVIRLFEGKAFLVTALVPLIAGLTVDWFERRQRTSLVALGLAQVCAIGFSANGVYIGPFASGFVAMAYLAGKPNKTTLLQALALIPTLAYPVLAAATIVIAHLGQPSEMTSGGEALSQLLSVAGGGKIAILTLVPILIASFGLASTTIRRPAAAYIPVTLVATLNPASWAAISAFTGLLGFRIFWAVPVPMLLALLLVVLAIRGGIRNEATLTVAAVSVLLVSIIFNNVISKPQFLVRWHLPTLKVDESYYRDAESLAAVADKHCSVVAPEQVDQWLTTIPNAPYPVFARKLYLVHDRFIMPQAERMARTQLADIVDEGAAANRVMLSALTIPIGTIAVLQHGPAMRPAATLAARLHLPGPFALRDMYVWTGHCLAK